MNLPASAPEPQPEKFAEDTHLRIMRIMIAMAILSVPAAWIRYDRNTALSFMAGCVISILNFHWLQKMVRSALDRAASSINSAKRPSGARVVLLFLLRYFLAAIILYAIFKGYALSVIGLLVGLSFPVGAVMMEAAYQTYQALRRGF